MAELLIAAEDGAGSRTGIPLTEQTDANSQSSRFFTAIHRAAESSNMELLLQLLNGGADVNSRDNDGQTPLHIAAYLGNVYIAKALIEVGADVNVQDGWDQNGRTPLHFAAWSGSTEVAKLLLDRGADINAIRWDGFTPLQWADTLKHTETAAIFREYGKKVIAK